MINESEKMNLVKDIHLFSKLNVCPGEKFRKYYYYLPSDLSHYELSRLDETVANYTSKKIEEFSKYSQDPEMGELFNRHIFVLNVFKNIAIMKYKPESQRTTYEKLALTVLPLVMSYVSCQLVSEDRLLSPFIAMAINSFSYLLINNIWLAEKRILSEQAEMLLKSPMDIKIDEKGIFLHALPMKGGGVVKSYYRTEIDRQKDYTNSLDFAVALNSFEAEGFLKNKASKLTQEVV